MHDLSLKLIVLEENVNYWQVTMTYFYIPRFWSLHYATSLLQKSYTGNCFHQPKEIQREFSLLN